MFWTRNWRGGAPRLVVLPALAALFVGGSALAGVTGVELISVASQPDFNANGYSRFPSVSADGQTVAFHSAGSNLVAGDTNGKDDVFVQVGLGTAERVSRAGDGSQANNDSFSPSISKDGVIVAFVSRATNLVAGDTNGVEDIFVTDRQSGLPERVSVTTGGASSNDASYSPSISGDGRYVAFVSFANNLVGGDTNGVFDVFVRDRVGNTTTRVSVDSAGSQGNGNSFTPSISADGRYVAFQSDSSNLVAGDTNGETDVFVRDLQGGTTERVSLSGGGTQGDGGSNSPSISADGRYVAFQSAANNLVGADTSGSDVFVRDRQLTTTERVSVAGDGSQGDGNSSLPNISGDGRFVTFQSDSTNFAAGDTNGAGDVFVRDRQLTTTERVSVAGNGTQGDGLSTFPVVSGNGRYVVFQSAAANLVSNDLNGADDIFVRDRTLNGTDRLSVTADSTQSGGNSRAASVSSTGRYVAFQSFAGNLVTGDTNGTWDIFVRDRQGAATERVSLAGDGSQSDGGSFTPSVSGDGRYVAFESSATNLVAGDSNGRNDIFVRDRQSNTTERVSVSGVGIQGNNNSYSPAISADGRFVVFASLATNLVTGDTNAVADIFLRDRQNNTTERISVSSASAQAGGISDFPSVNADGRYVVFQSAANNLVTGDTNLRVDIFLRDRQGGSTTRVNLPSIGLQGNNDSFSPRISGDGRYVGFRSVASNLIADDTNGAPDVFVRDRQGSTTTRVSLSEGGNQLNGSSDTFSLSADGRYVAFTSTAPNAVPGDTNGNTDVFVRDRVGNVTVRASVAGDGTQANGGSDAPEISGSGELVTFQSLATNLTTAAAAYPGIFAAALTWTNANPTAQDDNYALLQDSTLTVNAPGVLSNDSDPEGGAVTAVLAQTTAHGALTLLGDGSFLYQPEMNYVGADSFTYRAKDSSEAVSGIATVHLTVLRRNEAPVATPQAVTVQGGTAQTITLAGTDEDSDPLTFQITSLPQFGTLYVGSTLTTPITAVPVTLPANQVTYRTVRDQVADGFQFTVSDGTTESGAAAVAITVNSGNSLGKVTANGKLALTGGSAKVALSATRTERKMKGSLRFTDPVTKRTLKSAKLTSLVIQGTTAKVFGEGRFAKNGPLVLFMVVVEDLGTARNVDRVEVELADGRHYGPALLTGTVKITGE